MFNPARGGTRGTLGIIRASLGKNHLRQVGRGRWANPVCRIGDKGVRRIGFQVCQLRSALQQPLERKAVLILGLGIVHGAHQTKVPFGFVE